MLKKTILFIIVIFFLLSCSENNNIVIRSFCYWKTNMYMDQKADSVVDKLGVKHFYVRYFDVDWNPNTNEAQPLATIGNIDFNNSKVSFTPCVFITNDVMLKSNKPQLDSLVDRIFKRVESISYKYFEQTANKYVQNLSDLDYERQIGNVKSRIDINAIVTNKKIDLQKYVKDILIDCDWSEKSRNNYFYFLGKIKNRFTSYKIEATIRLWQYKFFEKAGVPPVDSGLLMCYNMDNPESRKTENSIGTNNELEKYIIHNNYKLKLNIALPLFSWSLVFRGNQFKGILSEEINFTENKIIFKRINDYKYILQDDIRLGEIYLRNGDEIRIEKVSDTDMKAMISTLSNKINIDKDTRVSFFSFNQKYINDYGTSNIDNFYSKF